MQTAPYVQSAKSRMAHFFFFFFFVLSRVSEHVCLRVCVCVRACACVAVVCVRLCNIMVIFVSEGNLLKDLYNSTLKF